MAVSSPNPTAPPNSPDRNELRESLRHTMTKEWMLSSNIWCADATGKKKETVKFPGQMFKVGPSEKMLDEVLAMFDGQLVVLQQTIEAGAETYTQIEFEEPVEVQAVPLSTITKAFEAARGKE